MSILSHLATAIAALVIAHHLANGTALLAYRRTLRARADTDSDDSDDISDDDISPSMNLPAKLTLIARTDLRMDKGKIVAQCAHATLACYKATLAANPALLKQWERSGQPKIALKCASEQELLALQAKARSLNLCARTIHDA